MIALDDAAWAAPWRHVRVSQKLCLSLGLVVTALIVPVMPGTLLVILAVLVLMIGVAKIPARAVLRAFRIPLVFIIVGAISIMIQVGSTDDTWWRLGIISVSEQSIADGVRVLYRSTAGTLSVFLLAMTTPMVDLLGWMRRVGVPGTLVEIASLMYRLLFVLGDSAVAINAAQAARLGHTPVGSHRWQRRWVASATALSALMTRTWLRAERLTDGLAARGIDGDLKVLDRQPAWRWGWLWATTAALAAIWCASIAWVVWC